MTARQDLAPLPLGRRLRQAELEVRVVAPADFAAMLTPAGLPRAPLAASVEEVLRAATRATERGQNIRAEDGVAGAVEIFGRLTQGSSPA